MKDLAEFENIQKYLAGTLSVGRGWCLFGGKSMKDMAGI